MYHSWESPQPNLSIYSLAPLHAHLLLVTTQLTSLPPSQPIQSKKILHPTAQPLYYFLLPNVSHLNHPNFNMVSAQQQVSNTSIRLNFYCHVAQSSSLNGYRSIATNRMLHAVNKAKSNQVTMEQNTDFCKQQK